MKATLSFGWVNEVLLCKASFSYPKNILSNIEYLTYLKFRAPLIYAQSWREIYGSENILNFDCAKINGSETFEIF